jgi:hypothetical protein
MQRPASIVESSYGTGKSLSDEPKASDTSSREAASKKEEYFAFVH